MTEEMLKEAPLTQKAMTLVEKASMVMSDDRFEPSNFESAMHMAQILSRSSMVPKHFQGKPEDILLTFLMARQYGLPGILLVQEGHVIQGKFGLPAIMLDAQCQRHPDCELMRIVEATEAKATVEVKRRGWPDSQRISFTMEEARKAGLLAKGGSWAANPVAMLIARARSRAARTYFPEVATGLYAIEELRDGEGIEGTVTAAKAEGFQAGLQAAKAKSSTPAAKVEPVVIDVTPKAPEPPPVDDEQPDVPPPAEREPGDDDEPVPTGEEIGRMFGYPPPETSERGAGSGRRTTKPRG